MVKRAKLTLEHPEKAVEDAEAAKETQAPRADARHASPNPGTAIHQDQRLSAIGKGVLLAGVTITLLLIFRRKLF